MNRESRIYVAGHNGMVGSAIVRKLQREGFRKLIALSSDDLDLRNQQAVESFFLTHKPDYVFLAAATVGGIHANNTFRADFIYNNIQIQANVIHFSHLNGVKKLLFLGSSCIYPKSAPQPLKEQYLLSGFLETTNEPYAIAKIAGIKMCQAYRSQHGCNFISVMPTNLYGSNDNYDPMNAHVLPALLRKFHEARIHNKPYVEVWGTGKPKREFLHVDDLADACVFLMKTYDDGEPVNVGTGEDLSIAELASLIRDITGYKGDLRYDTSRPDGTPRKLLDVSKIHGLGWHHRIHLERGIKEVYEEITQKELFTA